mgnify:CR=1 FL=1
MLAAVIALDRALFRLRNFAPVIRSSAITSPKASTITMHCGWPISSALAIPAASIAIAPAWVSADCVIVNIPAPRFCLITSNDNVNKRQREESLRSKCPSFRR